MTTLLLPDHAHTETDVFVFSEAGDATVRTGNRRLYLQRPIKVLEIEASVGTAPTDASLIVDVNVNGETIFATPADRPTIAASGFVDSAGALSRDTLVGGEYLTMDIDQIGSTIAGADLTVVIRYLTIIIRIEQT
jgi:hypothetical protein